MQQASAAADRDHYFQAVAIIQLGFGILAARNDFAVPFDRHALALKVEQLDQPGDRQAGCELPRFAVDKQINQNFNP
jgi:hypothetical protein